MFADSMGFCSYRFVKRNRQRICRGRVSRPAIFRGVSCDTRARRPGRQFAAAFQFLSNRWTAKIFADSMGFCSYRFVKRNRQRICRGRVSRPAIFRGVSCDTRAGWPGPYNPNVTAQTSFGESVPKTAVHPAVDIPNAWQDGRVVLWAAIRRL